MRGIELFSGCGGLALGLARAGVAHGAMVEWNRPARETLALNKAAGVAHAVDWPEPLGDARAVDWRAVDGVVDILSGGPPCQPFSIGGKHRGRGDSRDMWPEAIRAVEALRPKAFLFENVRGLARPAFAGYLSGITERLSAAGAGYAVRLFLVNAADFGAAQKRHRVVIVGARRDLLPVIPDLRPTHARAALAWEQWVSGDYWRRHGLRAPEAPPAERRLIAGMRAAPAEKPWRTVRDALAGIGAPDGANLHILQPGARAYVGHTGSPLDQPAKALKAGDHGVPGGENMLVGDDGRVRYFTIREAARLQGFPDDWRFAGAWSEAMRQLGNAVPVNLSEALGRWLIGHIRAAETSLAA